MKSLNYLGLTMLNHKNGEKMTLSKIKTILADGGNCTALVINTPFKDMKHGTSGEVLSADENGFTILRSDTKTRIKVLAREINMFEYMYDDNKKV